MRAEAFREWLAKAEELTPTQRKRALEELRRERPAPDPVAAVLGAQRACPHCHHSVCQPWGRAHGVQRFAVPPAVGPSTPSPAHRWRACGSARVGASTPGR